ncbi:MULTISPECIES: hypothetical protein [unclassified Curtobacterium]|uniref:hypothetical protein n=1 Tax=unclassified Curtobacterium TaxID=257496 RepID=UPI00232D9DCB|nr:MULTISPECIES: hypothetical protein [unclassified Curtobacterium]MDT0212120.1 hypothetical protein [Curtobacterium sp. BRD11]
MTEDTVHVGGEPVPGCPRIEHKHLAARTSEHQRCAEASTTATEYHDIPLESAHVMTLQHGDQNLKLICENRKGGRGCTVWDTTTSMR